MLEYFNFGKHLKTNFVRHTIGIQYILYIDNCRGRGDELLMTLYMSPCV